MATQTIEFAAVSGRDLVARLFPLGSDAQTSTDKAAVEQTNRKGLYLASWTDAPAGDYTLHAFDTETERVVAVQRVKMAAATGVYREWSDAMLQGIFDKPGAELTPEQVAEIGAQVIAALATSGVTVSGFLTAALAAIRQAVQGAVIRADQGGLTGGKLDVWLRDQYGTEHGRPLRRVYTLSAVPWLEERAVELWIQNGAAKATLAGSVAIADGEATLEFAALGKDWGSLAARSDAVFQIIQRFPTDSGTEWQTVEDGKANLRHAIPPR